jgi:class 3 adenylate cyclase
VPRSLATTSSSPPPVEANGGVRPKEQGEGDSIVAAFGRAADAVTAADDAQRRIHAEHWPTATPLRVRMAVHTGDVQLGDEANYVGNTIIRTARLCAIAHGGQVLVSGATRDLAVDELGAEVELIDLGSHRSRTSHAPNACGN